MVFFVFVSRRFGIILRNSRMRCTPTKLSYVKVWSEVHRILLNVSVNLSWTPTHIAVPPIKSLTSLAVANAWRLCMIIGMFGGSSGGPVSVISLVENIRMRHAKWQMHGVSYRQCVNTRYDIPDVKRKVYSIISESTQNATCLIQTIYYCLYLAMSHSILYCLNVKLLTSSLGTLVFLGFVDSRRPVLGFLLLGFCRLPWRWLCLLLLLRMPFRG